MRHMLAILAFCAAAPAAAASPLLMGPPPRDFPSAPPAVAISSPAHDSQAAGDALKPATPQIVASRAIGDRMTKALNLLEARGYGDFSGFRPGDGQFHALAACGDRWISVVIDPGFGEVSPTCRR